MSEDHDIHGYVTTQAHKTGQWDSSFKKRFIFILLYECCVCKYVVNHVCVVSVRLKLGVKPSGTGATGNFEAPN